jgi:hypothetical protein
MRAARTRLFAAVASAICSVLTACGANDSVGNALHDGGNDGAGVVGANDATMSPDRSVDASPNDATLAGDADANDAGGEDADALSPGSAADASDAQADQGTDSASDAGDHADALDGSDAAMVDASGDVNTGPTNIACNCSGGAICGSGAAGDPWRCCNLAQDNCAASQTYNPCAPMRCAPKPGCCARIPPSCGNCSAATGTCQYLAPVADGTVCSDLRACSSAVPPPVIAACAMRPAGGMCTKDTDCTAPGAGSCSGVGASSPGNPSSILEGSCCPVGTACDGVADPDAGFALGRCLANNGTANITNSNDVCSAGVCVTDAAACP